MKILKACFFRSNRFTIEQYNMQLAMLHMDHLSFISLIRQAVVLRNVRSNQAFLQ